MDTTTNQTRLTCGECGTGHYGKAAVSADFVCRDCGHLLNSTDLMLDDDERIVTDVDGILTVVSEAF